jgi:ATP-dependent protease HslVU (ClpYQ) peptidase subunit
VTVIAYRDGVLAGDSGWSDNGVFITNQTKVLRLDTGVLYGGAGHADDRELLHLLKNVASPHRLPSARSLIDASRECGAIIVFPDGAVWTITTGDNEDSGVCPIAAPFIAIGSGSKIAHGAMLAGASAARAVEVTCGQFGDIYCKPPVHTLRLEPRKRKRK